MIVLQICRNHGALKEYFISTVQVENFQGIQVSGHGMASER